MTYAGFVKRVAAFFIDTAIYGVFRFTVAFLFGFVGALVFRFNPDSTAASTQFMFSGIVFLLSLCCYLIYYVWAESSRWQATIGKKLMGLKVTDVYGQRLSFWRSLGRNVGMVVSGLIIGVGSLMCIWTSKKQCLHDKMASCLVVDETPTEKRGCAIAAITVWLCLLFLMVVSVMAAGLAPSFGEIVQRAREAQMQANQRQNDMNALQERLRRQINEIDFERLENND